MRSIHKKSQERTEEIQFNGEEVEGESERQGDQPQSFELGKGTPKAEGRRRTKYHPCC